MICLAHSSKILSPQATYSTASQSALQSPYYLEESSRGDLKIEGKKDVPVYLGDMIKYDETFSDKHKGIV